MPHCQENGSVWSPSAQPSVPARSTCLFYRRNQRSRTVWSVHCRSRPCAGCWMQTDRVLHEGVGTSESLYTVAPHTVLLRQRYSLKTCLVAKITLGTAPFLSGQNCTARQRMGSPCVVCSPWTPMTVPCCSASIRA